jgi:hypothetical protein
MARRCTVLKGRDGRDALIKGTRRRPFGCHQHSSPSLAFHPFPQPLLTCKHHDTVVFRTHAVSDSGNNSKQDDSDEKRPPGTLLSALMSMGDAVSKRLAAVLQQGPAWALQVLRFAFFGLGVLYVGREYMALQNRRAPQEVTKWPTGLLISAPLLR